MKFRFVFYIVALMVTGLSFADSVRVLDAPAAVDAGSLDRLRADFFLTEPLLVFREHADFVALVDGADIDRDLAAELATQFRDSLDDEAWNDAIEGHTPLMLSQKAFVPLREGQWSRLSKRFIQRYYEYRSEHFDDSAEAAFHVRDATGARVASTDDPRPALAGYAARPGDVEALFHATIANDGHHYVVANRSTWPLITDPFRRALVDSFLPRNEGLDCRIVLTRGNAAEIARRFACGRDPARLTSKLARRLDRAVVELDLREVLPPFVRRHLNTFAPRSGPNCYNACLNVHAPRVTFERVTDERLIEELRSGYRPVDPRVPLRAGDLIIYEAPDEYSGRVDIQHAAVHVTEEIVFTKNGLARFHPFILQRPAELVALYFPGGVYRTSGFRRDPTGTTVGECSVAHRYTHPDLIGCESALAR